MPKLSTIIPCYNSEKFIGETIQSVLNQSFDDWELIIINDGSSDGSLVQILKYQKIDQRIKCFTIENGGVNKARNFGFSKANQESKYLHFLDSDDIIEPQFYGTLISFLESNNEFGAIYSNHKFINEKNDEIPTPNWGERLKPSRFWIEKVKDEVVETSFINISLWCKMVEPMVLLRKEIFEKTNKWDESFGYGRIGEGVVLFSQIALLSKVGYINSRFYKYRRHQNQSSQNSVSNSDNLSLTAPKIASILNSNFDKFIFKCSMHRYKSFKEFYKLKHNLIYNQKQFIKSFWLFILFYFCSIPLIFIQANVNK